MKLLFVQGGSRLKQDDRGNWYTDGNFNEKVWERYLALCDELTVLLRKEEKTYEHEKVASEYNHINTELINLIPISDIYRPVINSLNLNMHRVINKQIEKAVVHCDKAIIRSVVNYYTITTLKYCKKHNKPYLIEVTGGAWEGFWYHSLKGKIVSFSKEYGVKKYLRDAPYAVYVTNEVLQKRYPCKGKTLGCSDVELFAIDKTILESRLEKINSKKSKLIIGTAAFLNVKWKGQEYVIRALAKLKEMGFNNIEYQLIGAGDKTYLQDIASRYGVSDIVKILGPKPHDEVFEWIDSIGVYIQPSLQEGLCRSLVEAMSMACPIICSDVGGNKELANQELLFKKGSVNAIVDVIIKISNQNLQRQEAVRSFEKAKEYEKDTLDRKRNDFYLKFVGGNSRII